MRYLVKLVTPKKGIVLDPFAGTGTTGEACILENKKYYRNWVLSEQILGNKRKHEKRN